MLASGDASITAAAADASNASKKNLSSGRPQRDTSRSRAIRTMAGAPHANTYASSSEGWAAAATSWTKPVAPSQAGLAVRMTGTKWKWRYSRSSERKTSAA